ncbi:O-antigen ligase family protein [Spirulina major CS-329]|uniref:O-antigen ligase family protein n=1 Tax=Spirulina TaxID=1154 RepID=UPI0023300318|nr:MULTISPECIES: O-antigen ligase family protein [Spirulina]MDB9493668.1 O-antigen ligase family protein [Spirulina subsalsa CS-330]MDB9502213.1 O-antigen ligase family protein [Spirulina major CS-329]
MLRISLTREKAIEIAEITFAIVGILFFTRSLKAVIGGSLDSLVRYGVFMMSMIMLTLRWQLTLYVLSGDLALLALNALSFCSFSWSEMPGTTNVQVREILYMMSFALYIAGRFPLRKQVILLSWGLEVAALLSTIWAFTMPAGMHRNDKFAGAWKGIYPQKNELSTMMTLSAAAHLPLLFDPTYNRIWAAAGLGLSLFVTLMTTSKSGLIIFFVLVIALFLLRTLRWRNLVMVMIFSVLFGLAVPGLTVFFSNWDAIMIGLGRDPTLTGRTDIWGYSFMRLAQRPWLGYARGVFWDKKSIYPGEAGIAVVGVPPINLLSGTYAPPHAHNGVVDLLLEVGVVGLIFFVISLGVFLMRAIKRIYVTNTPEDFGPLVFFTFFFMYNITESLLMRGENIFWVYYMVFAYSIRLGGQEIIDEPTLIPRKTPEMVAAARDRASSPPS